MITNEEIEEYKKAIDFTGDLSKGQKNILKQVLSFSPQKGVTADVIKKITGISRQAASVHLQRLMHRKFAFRKKDRVYKYFANLEKLNGLLEEYKIAQQLNRK